jgi:hypothetical protein
MKQSNNLVEFRQAVYSTDLLRPEMLNSSWWTRS